MNAEEIREYCLAKNAVEEGLPFGNETLVFKVGGKIFLLLSLESKPVQFNAKSEPAKAIELRETYSSIIPGYHMNKVHWNTVICDSLVPKKIIFEIINDSYTLIVNSLPRKTKELLGL